MIKLKEHKQSQNINNFYISSRLGYINLNNVLRIYTERDSHNMFDDASRKYYIQFVGAKTTNTLEISKYDFENIYKLIS